MGWEEHRQPETTHQSSKRRSITMAVSRPLTPAVTVVSLGTVMLLLVMTASSSCCHGLSAASSKASTTFPTTTLTSIGKSHLAILDGAEWHSVQAILRDDPSSSTAYPTPTKYGYMRVATGRDDKNRRVVAMLCDGGDGLDVAHLVYEDSVAVIPEKVSEMDAIATFVASLSSVHCALPRVENVGGGDDSIAAGKAVVLGSSDVACFAAEGLASLGIEVFLVTPKGTANVKTQVGKLDVIKPVVGLSQKGFSAHVGQFDALVDTIGNERSMGLVTYERSKEEDFDDDSAFGASLGGSIVQLLKTRHNCFKYISTLTHSQNLVAKEGIFAGPGKADQYTQEVSSASVLATSREWQSIPPPKAMGKTVETLLQKGVIFTDRQRQKLSSKKSDAVRGWSLVDFWEQTSWPRDSSGNGSIRFGLPVREDLEGDEASEFMISESPYRPQMMSNNLDGDDYVEIGGLDSDRIDNRAIQDNPFVMNVVGVGGVQREIVETERNCILFLSAKFCKTCKQINPIYTRMARMNKEKSDATVSFVKAEASGSLGKELGRHLSVQAVPAFVFFRKGERFGIPLSVSKLPSRKIDRALELLTSGADWDDTILDES